MPLGPVEMLVVKFPGNQFTGDIMPAIAELVENGTVTIVDMVLVHKDAQGNVTLFEFIDLDVEEFGEWAPLIVGSTPMLNDDDVYDLAQLLENNSAAGVILFENTWAKRFADAIRAAKGEVLLNERIPRVVIEEIAAATA
jgi:uncharacterized membrane protein